MRTDELESASHCFFKPWVITDLCNQKEQCGAGRGAITCNKDTMEEMNTEISEIIIGSLKNVVLKWNSV